MADFAMDVLRLTVDLLPLLLALSLARLLRSAVHASLLVLNLWLFMELLTALVDPAYHFGDLLLARLVASGLQLGIAFAALLLWRQWRAWSESVTVH
jgi:hypothetical protein